MTQFVCAIVYANGILEYFGAWETLSPRHHRDAPGVVILRKLRSGWPRKSVLKRTIEKIHDAHCPFVDWECKEKRNARGFGNKIWRDQGREGRRTSQHRQHQNQSLCKMIDPLVMRNSSWVGHGLVCICKYRSKVVSMTNSKLSRRTFKGDLINFV